MDTRTLLVDSVKEIAELNPEKGGSDEASAAFNSFRRGVVHASSGRQGTPESLLADLEPKGHVLRFLVGVSLQRRILKKQVGAVLAELLHVDGWLQTLIQDKALCAQLPDDLASLLAEKEEEEKEEAVEAESETLSPLRPGTEDGGARRSSFNPFEQAERSLEKVSSPDKQGPGRPKLSQVRSQISKAAASEGIALPIRVACPAATGHYTAGNIHLSKNEQDVVCELLEKGRKQIESLDFSASDRDTSISAFETFHRAVLQVVNSNLSKQDDNVLECLEPKGKILEFLVDMYERHQRYRSRVSSTLMRLLNFDGWRHAADSDASVHAAVHDFEDIRTMGKVTNVGVVPVNLKSAAVTAAARGGIGALYVQIIAAYNLVTADSNGKSDPYVRVRLGSRTQRTPVVCDCLNPKWNANPFTFEVSSLDDCLKFECLDSDFVKDDPLGDLEITLTQAPVRPESSLMRCALSNVPHGELEFKLLYTPGKGTLQDHESRLQAQTTAATPSVDPCTPAGASALWSPWGPAPEVVSSQADSRKRTSLNPFETDAFIQQGGYQAELPGALESGKDPSVAFASNLAWLGDKMETDLSKSDDSQTSARMRDRAYTAPGPSAFRPTNPFSANVIQIGGTNPFEKDSKVPSPRPPVKEFTPRGTAFEKDPRVPSPRPPVKASTPRGGTSRNPFLSDSHVEAPARTI